MQLRELAIINGTLRDDTDIAVCTNCGGTGHRKYECPENTNVTVKIICKICGGAGHTSGGKKPPLDNIFSLFIFISDCKQKNDPAALAEMNKRTLEMDSEYASLMNELGGGNVGGLVRSTAAPNYYAPPGSAVGWQAQSYYGVPPGMPRKKITMIFFIYLFFIYFSATTAWIWYIFPSTAAYDCFYDWLST